MLASASTCRPGARVVNARAGTDRIIAGLMAAGTENYSHILVTLGVSSMVSAASDYPMCHRKAWMTCVNIAKRTGLFFVPGNFNINRETPKRQYYAP